MSESSIIMHALPFTIGCLCLAFGVLYPVWVRVRVLRLRQDLYDRRDDLFDLAVRLDELNDPAYRSTRLMLDGLIVLAEELSLTLLFSLAARERLPVSPRTAATSAEMRAAIEAVHDWWPRRLTNYLLTETASGWWLRVVIGAQALKAAGMQFSTTLMDSTFTEQMGAYGPFPISLRQSA